MQATNMLTKMLSQRERLGIRLRKEFHQKRRQDRRQQIETSELKSILIQFILHLEEGLQSNDSTELLEYMKGVIADSDLTASQIRLINDLSLSDDLIKIVKHSQDDSVLAPCFKILSILTGYTDHSVFSSAVSEIAEPLIRRFRDVAEDCRADILWSLGNLFSHSQSNALCLLLQQGFMEYLTSCVGTILLKEQQPTSTVGSVCWFGTNLLRHIRHNQQLHYLFKSVSLFLTYMKALAQKLLLFALTSMNFGCELFPLCTELLQCGQNIFEDQRLLTVLLCKLEERQCIELLSVAVYKFENLGAQVLESVLKVIRVPDCQPSVSQQAIIILVNIISGCHTGSHRKETIKLIEQQLDNGHLTILFENCQWSQNAQNILLIMLKFTQNKERYQVFLEMCSKREDLTKQMIQVIDSELG